MRRDVQAALSLEEGRDVSGRSASKGVRPAGGPDDLDEHEARFGDQLRAARVSRGLSIRGLARQLGVSASFLSQVENDKARPSVATLYAITSALDISIDELFTEDDVVPLPRTVPVAENVHSPVGPRGRSGSDGTSAPAGDRPGHSQDAAPRVASFGNPAAGAVVRPESRRALQLNSGVTWERLATVSGTDVDFLFVTYDVGGSSTLDERLMRHLGAEYGFVLRGQLEIVLGFESVLLSPGDSIAFDSTVPHRLRSVGHEPVEAVWFVHGRSDGV